MLTSLGIDSLGQNALLLVQMIKLFSQFLVLGHVLLGLLHADTVMLGDRVELGQAVSKFL